MMEFTGNGPSTLSLALVGICCLVCYHAARLLWQHRKELRRGVARGIGADKHSADQRQAA